MDRRVDMAGRARLAGSAGVFVLMWLAASAGRAQTLDNAGAGDAAGAANGSSANGNPVAQRAMNEAIPLTPEMIEELGRRYNAARRAQETATAEMAAPINRQINVSFSPGSATSIINTVHGYPTAVSFFDCTGQPWPIQWDTNSNPAAITDGANCNARTNAGGPSAVAIGFFICTPVKGSNVLEITPVSLAPRGGLVVALEGAPKPVTFLLIAGGGRYDANLSIHVADRGPHAKVEIMTQPNAPETGRRLSHQHAAGRAAGRGGAALGRGRLAGRRARLAAWARTSICAPATRCLSPEWTASESEGGTTVYAIPNTPVVLLSVNGRTVSASLKEGP